MAETTWDEVGRRFADLGRELQKTWQASATSSEAKEHLNDAGEKVRSALDDVAQTINRAAASSEVRRSDATVSLKPGNRFGSFARLPGCSTFSHVNRKDRTLALARGSESIRSAWAAISDFISAQ